MHDDYGMCCSEEMAKRCARDYEAYAREERRKDSIGILLSIAVTAILLILAVLIF